MEYIIKDKVYQVVVEKKNNKNTYIRLKNPDIILVTTHYLVSKKAILDLLYNNEPALLKMHDKLLKTEKKKDNFYYLGLTYDIIIVPTIKKVEVIENNIYTPKKELLDKWIKNEAIKIFKERLDYIYPIFDENIPYPTLKIRSMKTRWGVCNKKNLSITLNLELIKYSYEYIDYVIVHELSHLVYFDHSKAFWNVVSKYCPDYKNIRKNLKG